MIGDSPQGFDEALCALRAGRAVIFPTDTVYGLGVAVDFAPSPQELFRLKGRESGKPIAWLLADGSEFSRYGRDISPQAYQLAQEGWPGALTLVVRASPEVPPAFRSAAGTIGLRVPDHPLLRDLIRAVGCPLATTSANLAGRPPALSLSAIDPQLRANVSAFLQDDTAPGGVPSTVIDCSQTEPQTLRP